MCQCSRTLARKEGKFMYSFNSRIRYSEVDREGKITLNAILDYFQDCSSFHSEELGVGIAFLCENEMAWVLSYWQVEINRYPQYGEAVKINTWPYQFKGFFGFRNFTMEDSQGKAAAYANSVWTLLDLKTKRPVRVPDAIASVYELSKPLLMDSDSRKVSVPLNGKKQAPFPIHKYHIDTNQHVNNSRYIGMAQEYLSEEFKVLKMRAEYRKAAVYGDIIYPIVSEQGGKVIVNLADGDGKPYAIVELEEDI